VASLSTATWRGLNGEEESVNDLVEGEVEGGGRSGGEEKEISKFSSPRARLR